MRFSLVSILFLLFTLPASAKDTLVLGVNEGGGEMAGIVAHVNTSPDIALKLRVFPNHDALYAAFRAKEIDLAFMARRRSPRQKRTSASTARWIPRSTSGSCSGEKSSRT